MEFPITIGTYPIQKINTQTNGIIITQQPMKNIINVNASHQVELNTNTKIINASSQSQPLLLEGNMSSHQDSQPSTNSVPQAIIGMNKILKLVRI